MLLQNQSYPQLSLSIKKTKAPVNARSISNNSLFVTHEKLNLNNQQSSKLINSNFSSNYSINTTSPTSLDIASVVKRNSSKCPKQYKTREPKSFYSSLSIKNKSSDRPKAHVSATTRPPPYFKYSYTAIMPTKIDTPKAPKITVRLYMIFESLFWFYLFIAGWTEGLWYFDKDDIHRVSQ